MEQTWRDLLFAHWPYPLDEVQSVVPSQLPVDTFDGMAWIGVVPFMLEDLKVRGLPALPTVSSFPELNVRTYVTLDGRPGIWFFSLDCASSLAVVGGSPPPPAAAQVRGYVGAGGGVSLAAGDFAGSAECFRRQEAAEREEATRPCNRGG